MQSLERDQFKNSAALNNGNHDLEQFFFLLPNFHSAGAGQSWSQGVYRLLFSIDECERPRLQVANLQILLSIELLRELSRRFGFWYFASTLKRHGQSIPTLACSDGVSNKAPHRLATDTERWEVRSCAGSVLCCTCSHLPGHVRYFCGIQRGPDIEEWLPCVYSISPKPSGSIDFKTAEGRKLLLPKIWKCLPFPVRAKCIVCPVPEDEWDLEASRPFQELNMQIRSAWALFPSQTWAEIYVSCYPTEFEGDHGTFSFLWLMPHYFSESRVSQARLCA